MKTVKTLWVVVVLLLCGGSVFGQKTHKLVTREMEGDEVRHFFYNEQGQIDSLYCLETVSDWYETYGLYDYDENGNCIKESTWQFYNNKWTFVCYCEYKYNEKNQLSERYNYNSFGSDQFTLGGKITYEYNEAGNLSLQKTYFAGSAPDEFELFVVEEYSYNEKDLLEKMEISALDFYTNQISMTHYVDYTYDEKDQLISESTTEIIDGEELRGQTRQYKYDDAGNVTEEATLSASMVPQMKYIYHYDTEVLRDNTMLPFNIEEKGSQFAMATSPNVIVKQEWWQVPNEIDELIHGGDWVYTYEIANVSNESQLPKHRDPFRLFVRDRTLFLTDVCEGGQVQIFNAAGALVKDAAYRSSGISLKELPQGVYIVRNGRNVAKFVR